MAGIGYQRKAMSQVSSYKLDKHKAGNKEKAYSQRFLVCVVRMAMPAMRVSMTMVVMFMVMLHKMVSI